MSYIRKAVPQDVDLIGNIHYQAWMETYEWLLDRRILEERSVQKSAEIFRANGCRNVLVAFDEGIAAGFCGFGPARDADASASEGEIYGLYVLKDRQRRGLGRALIRMALESLAMAGFSSAYLWVLKSNSHAVSFYRYQGFLPAGDKTAMMSGIPVHELRFCMALKGETR